MTEDPGKTRATYRALLLLLVIYGGGYFFVRINDWLIIKPFVSKEIPTGYNDTIIPGSDISFEIGKTLQLAFYPLVCAEAYLRELSPDTDKRK